MLRHAKALLLTSISLIALTATTRTASADFLLGKPVEIDLLYPDINTVLLNLPNAIVGPGPEVDIFEFNDIHFLVDIDDNSITTSMPGTYGSTTYVAAAFNGFVIFDYTNTIAPFGGVTIDPATDVVGFDLSRVSFDENHIYVNLQGLTVFPQSIIKVDIQPAAAVPEPTSLAMLGVGVVGMLAYGWRRRSVRA